MRIAALALAVSAGISGCAGEVLRGVPVEVSDSAGVPRYRLAHLPPWNDEAYLWHLELETSIPTGGGSAGDAPLAYDPQGYARLPDGSLVVLDNGERRLVVLDPASHQVRARFGPSGQGPGEIRSSTSKLWPVDDQSFWIFDPGNARLSRFSSSGTLQEERRVAMSGMGGITVSELDTGRPWSWRVFFADPGAGLLTDSVGYLDTAAGEYVWVAAMPERPSTRSRHTSSTVLFDAMGWFAPVASGVVVGRSDGGVLRHYSMTGELLAVLEVPMDPRPIDQAEQSSILEEFYGVTRGSTLTSPPTMAEEYPLYNIMWQVSDSLFALQQGHRSTPAGEPRIPDGQWVWRVFSVAGGYAGTIAFPPGVALPYFVEQSRITATHRDELGVATIQTYRVSPPQWHE